MYVRWETVGLAGVRLHNVDGWGNVAVAELLGQAQVEAQRHTAACAVETGVQQHFRFADGVGSFDMEHVGFLGEAHSEVLEWQGAAAGGAVDPTVEDQYNLCLQGAENVEDAVLAMVASGEDEG